MVEWQKGVRNKPGPEPVTDVCLPRLLLFSGTVEVQLGRWGKEDVSGG